MLAPPACGPPQAVISMETTAGGPIALQEAVRAEFGDDVVVSRCIALPWLRDGVLIFQAVGNNGEACHMFAHDRGMIDTTKTYGGIWDDSASALMTDAKSCSSWDGDNAAIAAAFRSEALNLSLDDALATFDALSFFNKGHSLVTTATPETRQGRPVMGGRMFDAPRFVGDGVLRVDYYSHTGMMGAQYNSWTCKLPTKANPAQFSPPGYMNSAAPDSSEDSS